MTDHNISFQADFTLTPDFALTRDTTISFQTDLVFASQFNMNVNALVLTPDTPASLTFTPDTAGSLG